jgi:hypothetical protein
MKKSELRVFIQEEIKSLTESKLVKLDDINYDDYHVGDSINLPHPTQADAIEQVKGFQKQNVENWKKEWKKKWGDTIFEFNPRADWHSIITVHNNPKYTNWREKMLNLKAGAVDSFKKR